MICQLVNDFWNFFFIYGKRAAHEALHKAHKGHESMHAQMLLILMVTVLVAQVVLVEWRKRHFRSYQVQPICYFLSDDQQSSSSTA